MKRNIIRFFTYFIIVSFVILWIQSMIIYISSANSEDNMPSTATSYSEMVKQEEQNSRTERVGKLGWAISFISGAFISGVIVANQHESRAQSYAHSARHRKHRSGSKGLLDSSGYVYNKYSNSIRKI